MARSQATDPMQNFKFRAEAFLEGSDALKYVSQDGSQAGFSAVGVPEITVESVEYKEGTDLYKRRYPGSPTWSDTITLSRGAMLRDTSFYDWIIGKVVGGFEYRADMTIYHYHRSKSLRLYSCYEAFPTRVKLAADLDATSSDIRLAEIDIAYEWAEMSTQDAPT